MPDPTQTPQVTRTVQRRPVRKGNDLGTNLGIFALTFLLSLGGGYLMFNQAGKAPAATSNTMTSTPPAPDHTATATDSAANSTESATDSAANSTDSSAAATTPVAASSEGEIFTKRGCVGCHSVSALGVSGGVTGPDLSKAFVNVADKHGVPIEDFLKKPTSAVMSGVLGGNPLTDDERAQVLAALKSASEK